MKQIFLSIALSVCVLFLNSQSSVAQEWQLEEESTELKTETTLSDNEDIEEEVLDSVTYASVLVIPFKPRMYLSDAERDIAKATKKDSEVNQRYFRYQVERTLVSRLQQSYGVKSLYFDTTATAEDDLINIYSKVSYSYQEPVNPTEKRTFLKFNKKEKPDPETLDPTTASKYRSTGENEYMSVDFKDYAILQELNEKYGTQLFLFINQFEIKTNYNTCLDIANKIYQREVIWHYSLLDINGNVLLGNTAKAYFPSNSNKAESIVYSCFPKMAEEIVRSIP